MAEVETFGLGTWSTDGGVTHKHKLILNRTPWVWDKLETVACLFCGYVTGHRWCHKVCEPFIIATDKRTRKFEVPVTESQAQEIIRWRFGEEPWWLGEEAEVIDELSAEAEAGYDIERLRPRDDND